MGEAESDQGFTVRDRRRRTDDANPEAPRAPEPPRPTTERRPPASPAGGRPAAPDRSLVGLFMMLASLAMTAMEGVPDPATGRARQDLRSAAEIIDTLTLLRERTEGRRTAEESEVLGGVIYELQMRYVQATRAAG